MTRTACVFESDIVKQIPNSKRMCPEDYNDNGMTMSIKERWCFLCTAHHASMTSCNSAISSRLGPWWAGHPAVLHHTQDGEVGSATVMPCQGLCTTAGHVPTRQQTSILSVSMCQGKAASKTRLSHWILNAINRHSRCKTNHEVAD